MNHEEIIGFIQKLSNHYRIEMPKDIDYYLETLSEYTRAQVGFAAKKHITCPKRGSYFPTIADLVKHIEIDKKTKIIYCNKIKNGKLCPNVAQHFLSNDRKFCDEHFEDERPKSDWEDKFDWHVKSIQAKAKDLGMTNEEYFRHCHPNIFKRREAGDKTKTKTYSNVVDLMSKLAGK